METELGFKLVDQAGILIRKRTSDEAHMNASAWPKEKPGDAANVTNKQRQ